MTLTLYSPSRLVSLVLEYFRSLDSVRVPPQHFLNELLINLLVQREDWFQLHQLLQYQGQGRSNMLMRV